MSHKKHGWWWLLVLLLSLCDDLLKIWGNQKGFCRVYRDSWRADSESATKALASGGQIPHCYCWSASAEKKSSAVAHHDERRRDGESRMKERNVWQDNISNCRKPRPKNDGVMAELWNEIGRCIVSLGAWKLQVPFFVFLHSQIMNDKTYRVERKKGR